MAKSKRSRKAKSPEQVRIEAEQRKRNSLIAAGIPAQQVEGCKVYNFELNVRSIRKPAQSLVDKWFKEGGPGFDEPQARAIEHCRELWHATGNQGKLVANLDWIGGGGGGPERGWEQAEALAQLDHYKHEFLSYWSVFEDLVRWDIPATIAGEHLAKDAGRQIQKCKQVVGMIASVIASARRY
jgi:hypothetical protein